MTLAPAERPQTPATYAAARGAHGGALSLAHMTPHEAWMFCESLAATPLLPDVYRKQPASILWAMEYGRALGLDVITTITTIHVIKGKPCQSADLMLGRARSAGHRVRIKSERHQCTVSIQRHDDPDDETVIEWTLDDAVTAGLCEMRGNRTHARDQKNQPTPWEKFPRAMLRARAIAECVRSACPEVLHGAIYTPEELGEVVDQEGNPVVVVDRADAPVHQTATVVQSTPNQPPARDYLAEAVAAAWPELDEIEEAARENGAPAPYMAALADVRTAHAAQDVTAVRELHRTLQEAGAEPGHLARIATIGATKPGAKTSAATPPAATAEKPTEPDPEHAAAMGEMYDAAQSAGLTREEADALMYSHHHTTAKAATVAALRSQRDDLLDAVRQAGATA